MKRLICIMWFTIVATISISSQTQRYYCEVKGVEKDLSSGLKIIFDFGDKASYTVWGDLSSKLKFVDENGAEIKFNSMVDAANYMVKHGWNFQQAYSSVYGSKLIIHWIFYKDAESMKKAAEGIMTKEKFKKKFR